MKDKETEIRGYEKTTLEKNNKKVLITLCIVFLGVLLVSGILLYNKFEEKKIIREYNSQILSYMYCLTRCPIDEKYLGESDLNENKSLEQIYFINSSCATYCSSRFSSEINEKKISVINKNRNDTLSSFLLECFSKQRMGGEVSRQCFLNVLANNSEVGYEKFEKTR